MPSLVSTPDDWRAFRQLIRLNTISSQSIIRMLDMLEFARRRSNLLDEPRKDRKALINR
jgi:hypothetical protein